MASQANDVSGLLSEAGVTLGQGDLVFPSRDTKIAAGMSVVVRHAVPVTVMLGDSTSQVRVVGRTVADALVAAGVDPAAAAGITPSLDTPLTSGMRISVPQSFARVSAESTSVAFVVVERRDGMLPKGARRLVRAGRAGTLLLVYRTLVVNGVESSATLAGERVVANPVAQIVAVGTGDGSSPRQLQVARIASRLLRPSAVVKGRRIRVVTTAYSAAEPGASDSTAMGVPAQRGVIAVDPSVIPLGSHVYVPGYGYAIAADTGGMINGRHIDLCFNSMSGVNGWGRRVLTIVVLD